MCSSITTPRLRSGYRYFDANTDDAGLVLRPIRESVAAGGLALNYASVESLLKTRDSQVCGVVLRDTSGEAERQVEIQAKVVMNATGAWADELREKACPERSCRACLQPLRGSHLVLDADAGVSEVNFFDRMHFL
jgi:glycerol-3-phosphate dehydrogenase